MRYNDKTSTEAKVYIEEENSGGDETDHDLEIVGYLSLFSR